MKLPAYRFHGVACFLLVVFAFVSFVVFSVVVTAVVVVPVETADL